MSDTTAATTRTITLRCQFCQSWNRIDANRAGDRPVCGKCKRPMLIDRPVPLDDESFARTISDTQLPVVVDFYADWCGPCKAMAPAVDDLAGRHQGEALVAKLNTDRAPRTAEQFQIRGIPTTIVFQGGREVARQAGAMPLAGLEALLARATR